MLVFFFFKQKTAYEMRISDWSSDVCSSDLSAIVKALLGQPGGDGAALRVVRGEQRDAVLEGKLDRLADGDRIGAQLGTGDLAAGTIHEIGRASCRERVCQYV